MSMNNATEYIMKGHAKILVGLDNSFFIAKKIIEKKLSVRQSETLVRSLKGKKRFLVRSSASFINSLSNIPHCHSVLSPAKFHIGVLVFDSNRSPQPAEHPDP